MSEELKPCPFCGGDDVVLRQPPHQNFIECNDCQACANNLPTEEQAIDAWNTRVESSLIAALESTIAALEVENRELKLSLPGTSQYYVPKDAYLALEKERDLLIDRIKRDEGRQNSERGTEATTMLALEANVAAKQQIIDGLAADLARMQQPVSDDEVRRFLFHGWQGKDVRPRLEEFLSNRAKERP